MPDIVVAVDHVEVGDYAVGFLQFPIGDRKVRQSVWLHRVGATWLIRDLPDPPPSLDAEHFHQWDMALARSAIARANHWVAGGQSR